MDKVTEILRAHHTRLFAEHGATPRGVDWNDQREMEFRYEKMLGVLAKDFYSPAAPPTLLDVGCGWGGLLQFATASGVRLAYTGIDVVETMIDHCRVQFPESQFLHGDVFDLDETKRYDFVVCNAILTQKLTASNMEMEHFAKRLIRKMFALSSHGIAFNMLSNQVNFTVQNLHYKSPVEMLAFCLSEIGPRVRLDHGYSSLGSGKGKYYDFTVYAYKD
jgi:SAM-dependent methyltransferase